jgi:hypothetical protein
MALALAVDPCAGRADEFVIQLNDQQAAQLTARWAGEGRGATALEFPDGRLELVPSSSVLQRTPGPDPTPLAAEELQAQILEQFGPTRTVCIVEKPFVIAIVQTLNGTRNAANQPRYRNLCKKAAGFFKGMQNSFIDFIEAAKVDAKPLRYPLVSIIFESKTEFWKYTQELTDQPNVANIAAFYDLLSNRLVMPIDECTSFDTPLHEAVHQQVYNRQIFQRLAPVPLWLNEGMAAGFEGDGEKVRSGPKAVSQRYATMALRARVANWRDIVAEDRLYQGSPLAGEAYGQAWGLHWLLVTEYREQYHEVIRHYSQVLPLSEDTPQQRVTDLEQIVGKSLPELQAEFYEELPRAVNRRKR